MSIFELADIIGSLAFATSGLLVGMRKNLDIMGMFIVSFLTANGGGVVRDLLIDRTPSVLTDPSSFYLVIAILFIGWLIKLQDKSHYEEHIIFVISDAIGLVAFSVTGALLGIEAGLSVFGVMILAFLTASGGGVLRDILVNEVPTILNSDFYGSIAVLLAAYLYLIHHFFVLSDLHITLAFVTALSLRLIAYYKGWKLPRIQP